MAMPKQLAAYWKTHRRGGGKSKSKGVSMAKKNGNGKKRGKFTLPMAAVIGFLPLVNEGVYWWKNGGGFKGLVDHLPSRIFPYDQRTGKWTTGNLRFGLYPILAGYAVHKLVGQWFGVNKMLARMGVPVIRL